MADHKTKLMSHERVETLIDCYGGSSHAWPVSERAAAEELVRHSPSLQRRCKQAARLDSMLKHHKSAITDSAGAKSFDDLQLRILAQLPEQNHDAARTGILDKGRTHRHTWVWRGVAAGFAVIALAVTFYMSFPLNLVPDQSMDVANSFDSWAWSESLDQPAAEQAETNVEVVVLLMPELNLGPE